VSIQSILFDSIHTDLDSVEADARQALETVVATPDQDLAQSKAALPRLLQRPRHQQHLDLLSNV
jgi:hypothetical protein